MNPCASQLYPCNGVACCPALPPEPTESITATFAPEKDVSTELHIQALVGHKMSDYYHVFELDFKLPKFSMYVPVKDFQKDPESSVRFTINERVNRVAMWMQNSFNLGCAPERSDLWRSEKGCSPQFSVCREFCGILEMSKNVMQVKLTDEFVLKNE